MTIQNPYSTQTISGYNASPPPDDGTAVLANKVEWAKHKTKLADPVKTLSEGINSMTLASFSSLCAQLVAVGDNDESNIVAARNIRN